MYEYDFLVIIIIVVLFELHQNKSKLENVDRENIMSRQRWNITQCHILNQLNCLVPPSMYIAIICINYNIFKNTLNENDFYTITWKNCIQFLQIRNLLCILQQLSIWNIFSFFFILKLSFSFLLKSTFKQFTEICKLTKQFQLCKSDFW